MKMNYENIIKKFTGAKSIYEIEVIQKLWSGYGKIVRYGLTNCELKTVVVKQVELPKTNQNWMNYNSDLSHKRKLKSYKVETNWYKNYSYRSNESCYIPKCFGIEVQGNEIIMVLEDLCSIGYLEIKNSINYDEMYLCISWMANFHATYMFETPDDLWKVGTYWHLDTREFELQNLKDIELKKSAHKIDLELKKTKYKTLVHGDAKLANFCFKKSGDGVAAVDFQYVGIGCGMKDLVYFVGSCLSEDESENMESLILERYFIELKRALIKKNSKTNVLINFEELENNWRELYPIAWADFHRFLKGWTSENWNNYSYSERVTKSVIKKLSK